MSDSTPSASGYRSIRLVKLVASLIALLATVLLVGARSLFARLYDLDVTWVMIGLAVTIVQFALLGARWWFVARRLGVSLTYFRAIGEYYLSTLINSVMPLGVFGDTVRVLRHVDRAGDGPADRPVARIVSAVVLERASGQMALWIVVLTVAPNWWHAISLATSSRPSTLMSAAVLMVVVVAIGAGVIFGRRWIARLYQAAAVGGRVLFLPRNLLVHLPLSFALVAVHIILFIIAAHAIGLGLTLGAAIRIVPPVLAAASAPAFFGGFGMREAAAAGLYRLTGLNAADGAAISFVYGVVGLLASVPGLLALRRRRR